MNQIRSPPKHGTDAPAPPQRLKACPPAADAVIVIVAAVGEVQLQAEAQYHAPPHLPSMMSMPAPRPATVAKTAPTKWWQ